MFAINVPAGGHPLLGCRIVAVGHVETTAPQGAIDVAQPQRGGIALAGWAFDADSIDPIYVHVYIDGVHPPNVLLANASRPDVGRVYPIAGGSRGYSSFVPAAPGPHDVCVYAINDNLTGPHSLLGCRHVDVPVPDIAPAVGALDVAAASEEAITIAGWAADPDTPDSIPVHAYIDGVLTTLWADAPRPDVATVFPAFGDQRGFRTTIAATPGPHTVCVYAINNNLVGPHAVLGCRSLNVPLPHGTAPVGALDVVANGGGQVTVAGWAIDPDTSAAIAVHVYIGTGGVPIIADGDRPDVGSAFPSFGPDHGYRVTLPVGSGAATVCVYAINDNPAAANTTLGCRSLR